MTDCLGLRHTAARGAHAATAAMKHLARVWTGIAAALDGDIQRLIDSKTLIWMPAHRTASDIGNALKSNDSPVTAREWRANRLVDGLAKLAAGDGAAPKATIALIDSAEILVRHSAAQLAVATYNANHHLTVKIKDDGTVIHCSTRDAQDIPKKAAGKQLRPLKAHQAVAERPPVPQSGATEGVSVSSSSSEQQSRRQRVRRQQRAWKQLATQQSATCLERVLQQPRRNHREEALDAARRQPLAKTLTASAAPPAAATSFWGPFLGMECDTPNPYTPPSAVTAAAVPASTSEPRSCDLTAAHICLYCKSRVCACSVRTQPVVCS